MVAVALTRGSAAGALTAAGLGAILVAVAGTLLVRARAYRAALLARRRDLEDRQT